MDSRARSDGAILVRWQYSAPWTNATKDAEDTTIAAGSTRARFAVIAWIVLPSRWAKREPSRATMAMVVGVAYGLDANPAQ